MDRISKIGIFLEVVKHQSFTAAARNLGLTGPAVSKQVQSLEDQLGVRLLHRTTRQVTLTEEGAIYAERARKALEDLHEAEQQILDLKDCPTGLLRVNAPRTFGKQYLSQPIAQFARKHPQVQMEVDFNDHNVDLIGEGYDVVIRIGAIEDSSYIQRQLTKCPILQCASPDLIAREGRPNAPADLIDYPSAIYTQPNESNEWRCKHKDGEITTVKLKRNFAANNGEMLLEACLEGLGAALLPVFLAAPHIQTGELIDLFPEHQTYPERSIVALFPHNRHLSTRVRLFVDWITKCSNDFPWISK